MFVGAVADNFGETIDQKISMHKLLRTTKWCKENGGLSAQFRNQQLLDENGNDTMEQQIQANYRQIKQDIVELVENELIRIENDPALKHLLGNNETEPGKA